MRSRTTRDQPSRCLPGGGGRSQARARRIATYSRASSAVLRRSRATSLAVALVTRAVSIRRRHAANLSLACVAYSRAQPRGLIGSSSLIPPTLKVARPDSVRPGFHARQAVAPEPFVDDVAREPVLDGQLLDREDRVLCAHPASGLFNGCQHTANIATSLTSGKR